MSVAFEGRYSSWVLVCRRRPYVAARPAALRFVSCEALRVVATVLTLGVRSKTYPIQASAIKKGGFAVISGRPVKVSRQERHAGRWCMGPAARG